MSAYIDLNPERTNRFRWSVWPGSGGERSQHRGPQGLVPEKSVFTGGKGGAGACREKRQVSSRHCNYPCGPGSSC